MAAKAGKKGSDNFEKMKREMDTKKQRAKKQTDPKIPSVNPDNHIPEMLPAVVVEDAISTEIKKIEMVIFRIGDEEFSFSLSNVKEIIRLPSMTKVPNAPFFITGLCSLRGELLPVIDSRKLFGMADMEYSEGSRIVVTDIQGKKVGLIADRVSEVISVEESLIKAPPGSIKGNDVGFINGIIVLNDGKRLVMVLDAPKIVKIGTAEEYSVQQQTQTIMNQASNGISQIEEQVIIFNIGSEEYAININLVREIIRIPDITKVPHTPGYIEGILSVRGQLMAAVHLGKLLGKSCHKTDEQSRVVIIDDGNNSFGVVVDRVSQVMRLQRDFLKESHQSSNSSGMEYIKGFLNLNNGNRLVMILEPLKLISTEDIRISLQSDSKESAQATTLGLDEAESDMEHVVIFKLGEDDYGIRINHLKEINRVSEVVHFPGSPNFIDGMVNLRGEVIPLLNLKTLFNKSSDYYSSKFLVVEFKKKRIGIMIDTASEVLKFSSNTGDVLAEDVNNDRGITLVAKDTIINEYIKRKLMQNHALDVWLYESEELTVNHEDEGKYLETGRIYKEAILSMKEFLYKLSTSGSVQYQEVKAISDIVFGGINEDGHIIKCLTEIKSKDEYTYTHSIHVAFYAMLIAKWLNLSELSIQEIIQAGLLHDIGKVTIPNDILNKKGNLSQEEFEIMKMHTINGYELLKALPEYDIRVKKGVLSHHERVDGSGYPQGLTGESIGLYAKIIAIADVYDAMTQNRVYKKKQSPFATFEMFLVDGVRRFDTTVLNTFLKHLPALYVGTNVLLSNGDTGEIVYVPPHDIVYPIINVRSKYIDLSREKEIKVVMVV